MMRWWFWSILALIPNLIFAVKSSDDPFGGAICENTVSAFFVSDNTNVVWEGKVLLIDNITEDQCKEVCINNKDLKGRSILCASFTYDHVSFQCNIYRHRSLPDGTMARQYSPGKRYFEKFCIAEDLPVECANTMFIRADESIIKGYAKNTSIVPSMEECASRCLREEFDCKSAMYFYEEGECITNIESAMTKPEDFGHPDDGDRVVYFQNGCTREFINTLGQDAAKPIESETLFEPTTTEESVSTTEEVKAEETEAPSTTTEAPVETTEEAVEEKPVKPRKNKGSRRRGSAEIGSEEAPVPDQAEQEPQPAEPPATSAEIPPKEFPPSHPRKIKADSSEKSPPKPKKSHDSAEEEEKEPESIPQEPEAEPTTEQPESSTGALKDMEKELLELLNESSAAAADLGNDESDQEEQEKPQPKKAVSKKSKKKGEAKHKSSDEEALKEMQEIREMLKNRKEKNEDDDKQRKVKAHDEEEQEAQSEEVTQEPTTKRPKSSKRKQHRSEEEEEPKPREQEEEEVKEKAVEEEEKPLERKPKSEESVEEEQQEARPRQRSSKTNGVKKPLYAAKQLRHMSDGSLREISKEQEAKASEEAEPRRPKDPSPEEGHREPLPTAAPEKEELKAIRPTRVRKLGLKLNGEPRKINIRPLKAQSGEDGHDFTDPARERAQEDQQEERDEVDGYFSKWGDWTKCTHPGERRLRRRKCLDLKKCKGSLMQVSYCPKDLPAEVAPSQEPQEEQPRQSAAEDEPARPVRKPLPVEASSESGHPPGIMPPEMPEKEIKPLPVGAPGNSDEVWSPWLGVCQQFASTQPCKNGKVIGFESRECVAKDPKLCKGPFFRYCTLKC